MPNPFATPYPPSEYDMAPPPLAPAPLPSGPLSPPGNMPMDQQTALIEMIKQMAQSDDPLQKAAAQKFMSEHGRSMLAVGLNRATMGLGSPGQGLSDSLMTMGQTGAFSPQSLDFSKRLTQGVDPGGYHGAEMAGTAANLALGLGIPRGILGLARLLSPGGTPPGGPQSPGTMPPQAPLGPAGPQPGPTPGVPPEPPGGLREMQGPSQWPRVIDDLRGQGGPRPPNDPAPANPGELAVDRYLDTGKNPSHSRYQNRDEKGRFQKGHRPEPFRWYDPFSRLFGDKE